MTKRLLIAAATLAALAGCAVPNSGGSKFLGVANNAEASTRIAVLESVRFGTQMADTSNTWQSIAGQVTGGLIGGLAANQVHSDAFRPVATAGGTVAGAFVGSKITSSAGQVPAVELTYTYDACRGNDCTKTLVQRLEDDTKDLWNEDARLVVVKQKLKEQGKDTTSIDSRLRIRVTVGGGTGTRVIPL